MIFLNIVAPKHLAGQFQGYVLVGDRERVNVPNPASPSADCVGEASREPAPVAMVCVAPVLALAIRACLHGQVSPSAKLSRAAAMSPICWPSNSSRDSLCRFFSPAAA